jgi:hypothetical protein
MFKINFADFCGNGCAGSAARGIREADPLSPSLAIGLDRVTAEAQALQVIE